VRSVRKRFWVEAGAAASSGLLGMLTLVWPDWIEEIFGWDPDQHSGAYEWLIVALLAVVAVASAVLARIESRRSISTA
jgi:hypothetical protein